MLLSKKFNWIAKVFKFSFESSLIFVEGKKKASRKRCPTETVSYRVVLPCPQGTGARKPQGHRNPEALECLREEGRIFAYKLHTRASELKSPLDY